MAGKQRRKRNVGYTPKEEPIIQVLPDTITSQEDAKYLVESNYRQPLEVDYVVLENGHVFLGQNKRTVALKYAHRFDLKYFDVKL